MSGAINAFTHEYADALLHMRSGHSLCPVRLLKRAERHLRGGLMGCAVVRGENCLLETRDAEEVRRGVIESRHMEVDCVC